MLYSVRACLTGLIHATSELQRKSWENCSLPTLRETNASICPRHYQPFCISLLCIPISGMCLLCFINLRLNQGAWNTIKRSFGICCNFCMIMIPVPGQKGSPRILATHVGSSYLMEQLCSFLKLLQPINCV